MTATARQIGAIHTIAKRLGLADDNYRELLAATTGKRSARELSFAEAGAVIDRLKGLQGGANAPSNAAGARVVDGPYGPKARALWISGYHLGVVRERSDAAMFAFVARQTGISTTRWVRDPADGSRVVEALKSWLAREGGVVWPAGPRPDPGDLKAAVVTAQWRRLHALGRVVLARPWDDPMMDLPAYAGQVARRNPRLCNSLDDLTGAELDAVMEALGGRLRRALAQAAAAAADDTPHPTASPSTSPARGEVKSSGAEGA